jgi:hypothetical protein
MVVVRGNVRVSRAGSVRIVIAALRSPEFGGRTDPMTTATTLAGTFSPTTPVLAGVRGTPAVRTRAAAVVAFALALVWLVLLIPGLARVPAVAGEPGPIGAPVVSTASTSVQSTDVVIALPGPHPDR